MDNMRHKTNAGAHAQKKYPRNCVCAVDISPYSGNELCQCLNCFFFFFFLWHAAMCAGVLVSNSRKRTTSDKFLCTRCDKIAYLENWSFSKWNDVVAFSACLQLHNLPALGIRFCSLSYCYLHKRSFMPLQLSA